LPAALDVAFTVALTVALAGAGAPVMKSSTSFLASLSLYCTGGDFMK
jgi:hypothetical protein